MNEIISQFFCQFITQGNNWCSLKSVGACMRKLCVRFILELNLKAFYLLLYTIALRNLSLLSPLILCFQESSSQWTRFTVKCTYLKFQCIIKCASGFAHFGGLLLEQDINFFKAKKIGYTKFKAH